MRVHKGEGPGTFTAAFSLKEAKASFTHNRWGLSACRFGQSTLTPLHTFQHQGGWGRLRNCHPD